MFGGGDARSLPIFLSEMQQIKRDYPQVAVYVMSDVNSYYEKQGYAEVGTIFAVEL